MENKFPDGIRFYYRSDKAPEWVIGKLRIHPAKLTGSQVYNICISEKDPFDVKFYMTYGRDEFKEPNGKGTNVYPAGIGFEFNSGDLKWIYARVHVNAEVFQEWANGEDVVNIDVKKGKDGNVYLQLNTWKPN